MRLTVRVVRLSSRVPRRVSSSATYLLTLALDTLSVRAAMEKLPRVATSRKVRISSSVSIVSGAETDWFRFGRLIAATSGRSGIHRDCKLAVLDRNPASSPKPLKESGLGTWFIPANNCFENKGNHHDRTRPRRCAGDRWCQRFCRGYNNYPELPQPTSTLTRAQVQADLVQAAKNGTLEMNDATYPVVAEATGSKTRAEVQRELHAANQAVDAVVMQD